MRKRIVIILSIILVLLSLLPIFAISTTAQGCGPGVVHTVRAGETVYRISRFYGTTVNAIAQANGLVNPDLIHIGQQLTIPCASSSGSSSGGGAPVFPIYFPPYQVNYYPPSGNAPQAGGSCATFRAISPTDGLVWGTNVFTWSPVAGAVGYRVNIYNLDGFYNGALTSSVTTGQQTSVAIDTTDLTVGFGYTFAWDVQALGANGAVICSSSRIPVGRSAPATPLPTATATVSP